MNNQKQLRLPFEPQRETRAERIERLLGGELRRYIEPASQLSFTAKAADRAASLAAAAVEKEDQGVKKQTPKKANAESAYKTISIQI
jgi:hypothetical protein